MPAVRRVRLGWLAVAVVTVLPAVAGAQQPTRRRQAPIEIRGAVPTPQVVTVRPREVPTYSRQVLVPRFFDHDFWPDIQTGYLMVPERQITGRAVADSIGAGVGADTSAASGAMAAPPRLTPTTTPTPGTAAPTTAPSTSPPPARPDTTHRSPGTASAPPAR